MLRPFTIAALFVTTSAVALPTYACDMHGGGFGFGNPNANWQSYNPRTSTIDPAFLGQDTSLATPVPAAKARPSFSNAANRAAVIAKARVAKKTKDETSKASKEKLVKKAVLILDANR